MRPLRLLDAEQILGRPVAGNRGVIAVRDARVAAQLHREGAEGLVRFEPMPRMRLEVRGHIARAVMHRVVERALEQGADRVAAVDVLAADRARPEAVHRKGADVALADAQADRKSTRLNSSHVKISYAVFCL